MSRRLGCWWDGVDELDLAYSLLVCLSLSPLELCYTQQARDMMSADANIEVHHEHPECRRIMAAMEKQKEGCVNFRFTQSLPQEMSLRCYLNEVDERQAGHYNFQNGEERWC